jgi:hypothetical protein
MPVRRVDQSPWAGRREEAAREAYRLRDTVAGRRLGLRIGPKAESAHGRERASGPRPLARCYLQDDESVFIELTPRNGMSRVPLVPSVFVLVS